MVRHTRSVAGKPPGFLFIHQAYQEDIMFKRTLAIFVVALFALCGTGQAEPVKLTFSTGSMGGGFFAVGSGIADYISKSVPGINVTAITSAGVVESINRLDQSKADFAMLNTQDPPLAWEGKAPYKKKYQKMRGMGILYMQAAQPYTLKSSNIRTFKDLKGKTISVGAPGGTMHLDFFRWVEANGLDPKKDFGKVLFLPAREAMEAVKTGQVDVAVELSSIPSPQIAELSLLRPVHILEFAPGTRAELMQKYPQYLPTTVAKDAYNGIDNAIETVGTGAMFACREDLPEDLVYQIVKAVYSEEGIKYLGNVLAALKPMTPNLAVSYKPIPLHPGAERYFREIGLIRD